MSGQRSFTQSRLFGHVQRHPTVKNCHLFFMLIGSLKHMTLIIVLWLWLCLFMLPLMKRHKFDEFFHSAKLTSRRQSCQNQMKQGEATRLALSQTA